MKQRLLLVWTLITFLVACSAPAQEPIAEQPIAEAPAATTVVETEAPANTEIPTETDAPIETDTPIETEIPIDIDVPLEPPALDSAEYFYLQHEAGLDENKCLELQDGSAGTAQGTIFMAECQDSAAQKWKLVSGAEGYYLLQNQSTEHEGTCLEGNRLADDAMLGGASVMLPCNGASGQQWKFSDAGNGFYVMQTQFLEAENKCLEGQGGFAPGSGAVLDGAGFLNDCQGVVGQFWLPISSGPSYVEAAPPIYSLIPETPARPLEFVNEGEVLIVVDENSNLNGMSITAISSAEALEEISLGTYTLDQIPALPEWVTPLSDAFVVPNEVNAIFQARFPLNLPEGVTPDQVNLYFYSQVSDVEEPIWSPVWVNFFVEENEGQRTIVVQLNGIYGLAVWGYEQPSQDGVAASPSPIFKPASYSPQATTSVTCADQLTDTIPPSDKQIPNGIKLCTTTRDPEIQVSVRGFGSEKLRWGGISETPSGISMEQMVEYMVDAQLWFAKNGLGHDKKVTVYIHQLKPGLAGYVQGGPPENGQTLHLTNDNKVSTIAMQGTIVHEYYHHAHMHDNTITGENKGSYDSWILEGSARWFEDELFDDLNTYILKEGKGDTFTANGFAKDGDKRAYNRFSIFKTLTKYCSGFPAQIKSIYSYPKDSTIAKQLVGQLSAMGCNFGSHLGSDKAASIEAMLLFYNYATQYKDKLSLLDANEEDKAFFTAAPLGLNRWRDTKLSTVMASKTNQELKATVPPISAYSFKTPGLEGKLPVGVVAQLTITTDQPIVLSIASANQQLNPATNKIGSDPHTWYSLAAKGTQSYNYSADCTVPELFVTFVNANLDATYANVKATWQLVNEAGANSNCSDTPPAAAQPTTAPAQPTTAPAQPTTALAQPTTAPAQPTTAPAQPTAVPPTAPAAPATGNLNNFSLSNDQQYALRHSDNTFSYLRLQSARVSQRIWQYNFDQCPTVSTNSLAPLRLSEITNVTSVDAALAEGYTARNTECNTKTYPIYTGPANPYPYKPDLNLQLGRQYAFRNGDGTFTYLHLVRSDTSGYTFAVCPGTDLRRATSFKIDNNYELMKLMTVSYATSQGLTPANQACSTPQG